MTVVLATDSESSAATRTMPIEQSAPSLNPVEPLAPFNAWPIQLSDPDVGFAWYTSAATLVTQATPAHATPYAADVLSNWVDLVLERHHEEIKHYGGLLGVHDWRRFRSYDSEARRRWLQRIERRPKGYLRKGVIIVSDSPLLKMAVAGANMVVALASGGDSQFEIATNALQTLQKYDVRRPMV
jgi:hypothetical protein